MNDAGPCGDEKGEGSIQSLIDGLPESLAVIDLEGEILCVNRAWRDFSEANGGMIAATGPGANYWSVCERALRNGAFGAGEFMGAARAVLAGGSDVYELPEYACHSPWERRWFAARVAPFRWKGKGEERALGLVSHSNVTLRHQLAERVSELERFVSSRRDRERVDEWARFIVNEVRDPLSAALLQAQLLMRLLSRSEGSDKAWMTICRKIEKLTSGIVHLLNGIRNVIGPIEPERIVELRVADLVHDCATQFERRSEALGAVLEIEPIKEDLRIEGRRLKLTFVLMNVLLFALQVGQVGQAGGKFIRLSVFDRGDRLEIYVSGAGFFREPKRGEGVMRRLELEIAERVVRADGGTFFWSKGSRFDGVTLSLPKRRIEAPIGRLRAA